MPTRTQRRRAARGAHAAEINVTPLIDIVMVLIIFYLMVGSLISSDYADVPLPFSVRGEPAAAADVFVINIRAKTATGEPAAPGATGPAAGAAPGGVVRTAIVVQGVETDAPSLTRDLAERLARDPLMVIQLRAARDLPYRAVEPVVKACAKAGASSIRLVTERAP